MFQIVPLTPIQHKVDDSVVRIEYGPYEAHGIITHRIQRLRGLIRHLTDLGYDLELVQVTLLNRLQIIMFNRKIFQCDIRYMKFNMISEYDPVCLRVVAAVEEAARRMNVDGKESNIHLESAEQELKQEKNEGETEFVNMKLFPEAHENRVLVSQPNLIFESTTH